MTGKISLEGMEFHAFHGLHDFERESGNYFEVDLTVETDIGVAAEEDLIKGTINYEELYRLVKEEMEIPSHLLEMVANRISERIMQTFTRIETLHIKISKLNAPVGGRCRKASLELFRKRSG